MHPEIVLMLLFAHKDIAASPSSTGLQVDLFHPPEWRICAAYLFHRPRTAPPGAHTQQHTR